MMRIICGLPNDDLNAVPALVGAVEAAGYDGVTVAENAHNPFLPLAVAAVHSTRIQLATGVAIAFPRSPMMTANVGWDLQAASGGRFVLGLGSQVKAHNERRFATPWTTAPAPRMRDYVGAVRAIWQTWASGDKLQYESDQYQITLMTPNFTPARLDGPPPPIKISAVGPHMLRLAGEACDGVSLHGFCTRDYLANQIVPRLAEGMARTGRQREHFEISGGGFVATGATDEEVALATEWVRTRVGFYGSTKAYWPVLAEHGLEDLGHELLHLSRTGGWDQMPARVSDDVVRLFAAVGRYDELPAAIAERFGGLSDAVGLTTPTTAATAIPPDLIQELQQISTPFAGFQAQP
jgi:probable F420-dependent oxidoreductase